MLINNFSLWKKTTLKLIVFIFFSIPTTSSFAKEILIAIDGVSYPTFLKSYNGGYFRSFKPPSKMIATFPSISDPNWRRLLQLPPQKGMTKSYFDIEKNQIIGSLLNHISETPDYEKIFHVRPKSTLGHLATVTWTEKMAYYWLDVLEKEVFKFPNKKTKAFFVNTDLIAHTSGEDGQLLFLKELSQRLNKMDKKFNKKFNKKLKVTLISDHGNYFKKPKIIEYENVLKKQKWKLTSQLKNKNDVVFVVPEILSYGELYTTKGKAKALAQDISKIKGIHISMHSPSDNIVFIISNKSKGKITIDKNQKLVSYQVIKGSDPLEQMIYFKNKRTLTWDKYFELSKNSTYPYSLVRIWEGFYINSTQKPSVLVNAKLGFEFANPTLKTLTLVQGLWSSHGSLHREESFGVFSTNFKETYDIRPEDFHSALNSKTN